MTPSPATERRRRRVRDIRTTVAALAVSAFLALWSGLFVQLRSGNDPVLGASSTSTSATTSSSSTTSSSAGSDDTTSSDSDDTELPAATTSQS